MLVEILAFMANIIIAIFKLLVVEILVDSFILLAREAHHFLFSNTSSPNLTRTLLIFENELNS